MTSPLDRLKQNLKNASQPNKRDPDELIWWLTNAIRLAETYREIAMSAKAGRIHNDFLLGDPLLRSLIGKEIDEAAEILNLKEG